MMHNRNRLLVTAVCALFPAIAGAAYLESDYNPDRLQFPPPTTRPPIVRPQPRQNELQRLLSRVQVDAPTSHRGLTVFPLRLTSTIGSVGALTLDEATARGNLVVQEWGKGIVGRLSVHNRGTRPVFILEGESLVGGYQDRVVAESMIIAPGQRVVIPVYCSQRGRWENDRGVGREFKSNNQLAVPTGYDPEAGGRPCRRCDAD